MNLSGNTILITGGTAGIGLALAKKFVELGNEVIITGRSQERLDVALKEQPKLKGVRSDAADPKAIAELAREMKSSYPKLNVLVNNAGIMVYRNVSAGVGDLAALTSEVETNLCGPIRMVSALIDQLKANQGTIINVSSGLAWVPLQAAPIYCATKAAMHSYTLSLRNQLRPHGVEVIELAPPAVKTDLAPIPDTANVTLMSTDELVAAFMKALGKGKVEIVPGQAKQLRFMSRLAPNFITGQLAKASQVLIPEPSPEKR
jgi:uncharacterized oxidoreductase